MADKLTKKEKGFVSDFIETGNGVQSALKNYDTEDYSTAGVIAHENLKKPKIIKAIHEALPDDLLAEKHLELLNKKEVILIHGKENKIEFTEQPHSDVKGALDMAYKLKGAYAAEKHDIRQLNIEISKEIAEKRGITSEPINNS